MNTLRRPALIAALVIAGLCTLPAHAGAYDQPSRQQQAYAQRPVIELVFVLDTTGSMGGMLDGAKAKIWGIVNDVLQRQGNLHSTIRVGLVAYRDRGDAYLTKVTPLNENLDSVYSELMSLRAEGGGDTPEDVRSALAAALRSSGWSVPGPRTSQVVFLVGDAPPQSYANIPSSVITARDAARRGITVNAIQCGNDPDTTRAWREVAQYGAGEYFAIAQDGGVEEIVTPYDQPLAQLGQQIGATYMAYGRKDERVARQSSQVAMETRVVAAAPAVQAERALNKALNEKAYDERDLVQKVEITGSALSRVPEAELPDALRDLTPPQRQAALDKAVAERKMLKEKIVALSKQREQYLAAQRARRGRAGGLDAAISTALAKQIK